MKSSSSRRSRRRLPSRDASGPQQDQKKEQKFFGPVGQDSFFQPRAVINRAPESKGEEKKEEKIARAPEEEKKDEKVMKAPVAPEEEKKEEKISKAPEGKMDQDKEEGKVARAPEEDKKEEKISAAPEEEKKEEKIAKQGEAGGAGERTKQYVAGIDGKGQPLGSKEREFFGDRLGYDFGAVRVHTGKEAADSARDAGAKAYTYGNHLVFNEGRYNPESHEGRRLLAHELTHVVQQKPAPSGRKATTPTQVHRQTGDRTGTAAPGTTATDPAVFQSRLSIALSQMTTPTVVGETLSGALEPVLREMAANAEWLDAAGTASGGADVPVRLSRGGRMVRLRLILDDAPNPTLQGRFNSSGADAGAIRIFVRQNMEPDNLATTLYHESLHLMRWLSRHAPGGNLAAETGATGGRRMTLEGIDPARQPQHLAQVRRRVADLASSVNTARPASDKVDAAGIDRLADFMLEEFLTRVETEVFRLMRDSDAASRTRGASFRTGTLPDNFFPRGDVDKYLFEIASVFRAGDRDSLGPYDRVLIDNLAQYFRDRVEMFVRRRYSEVIHGPQFP